MLLQKIAQGEPT
jgi:peptidyl-tRNA hydrolase